MDLCEDEWTDGGKLHTSEISHTGLSGLVAFILSRLAVR